MKIRPIILIATLFLLSACSSIKNTQHTYVDEHINNIVWSVVSYKGHALREQDFNNGLPRIVFNMQDGKINGSDGCNSFMGIATYKDYRIKTKAIASTKMACTGTGIPGDFYAILSSQGLTWRLDHDNVLRLFIDGLEMMALKERE